MVYRSPLKTSWLTDLLFDTSFSLTGECRVKRLAATLWMASLDTVFPSFLDLYVITISQSVFNYMLWTTIVRIIYILLWSFQCTVTGYFVLRSLCVYDDDCNDEFDDHMFLCNA